MERETAVEEEPSLSPDQLHQLAETHLRMRNFSLSRQYLLELQSALHRRHSSTTTSATSRRRSLNRLATQLLTISDILTAATTQPPINHYSILQLDSFTTDHNHIRTQFKKLVFILDPIKSTSPLAQEALNHVHNSYNYLLDPSKKEKFDAELRVTLIHGGGGGGGGGCGGGFWTFCPYCFNLYEYEKEYQGCCLRCQNVNCRRAFEGVGLASLPRMELDKGRYFGCYGYFPMGFSPDKDGENEMGKFGSWSPLVGMFPIKRVKAPACRIDMNGDDEEEEDDVIGNGNGYSNGVHADGSNFIEIIDESEESEGEVNVPTSVPIVDKQPRMIKRKSVAWNARKLMRSGGNEGLDAANEGEGEGMDGEFGLEENDDNVGGEGHVGDLNEVDMSFFEEDGELFVDVGANDAP